MAFKTASILAAAKSQLSSKLLSACRETLIDVNWAVVLDLGLLTTQHPKSASSDAKENTRVLRKKTNCIRTNSDHEIRTRNPTVAYSISSLALMGLRFSPDKSK